MISLYDVSKSYRLKTGERKQIVSNLSLDLPNGNIGLLGRNGSGKSTFLRMLAGIEEPDSGTIDRNVTISWPIGFRGSFHRELTGLENVRFIARIYGQDSKRLIDYVEQFSELGDFFYEPVKTYSSGMVARLAFGASMAVEFDCYLIDELMAVGDARFKAKSKEAFSEKLSNSKIIMVSHAMDALKEYCQIGMVIHDGMLFVFEDLDDAIKKYRRLNRS